MPEDRPSGHQTAANPTAEFGRIPVAKAPRRRYRAATISCPSVCHCWLAQQCRTKKLVNHLRPALFTQRSPDNIQPDTPPCKASSHESRPLRKRLQATVTMEGSSGCQVRWLVDETHGAPNFAMRSSRSRPAAILLSTAIRTSTRCSCSKDRASCSKAIASTSWPAATLCWSAPTRFINSATPAKRRSSFSASCPTRLPNNPSRWPPSAAGRKNNRRSTAR